VGYTISACATANGGCEHERKLFRIMSIIVGVVGAVLGGFLWGMFTQDPDPYQFWHMGSWVTAIIGSSLLLWLVSFMRSPPSRLA
jgi:uncharacterized membrane protein YeaQ/YmgE (transglycosylase-associated protein family)